MPVSALRPDAMTTAAAVRAVDASAVPWLARYHGLRARLPGAGIGWVAQLREAAAEAFAAAGWPTRRQEAWKYTDLRHLAAQHWHEPLAAMDRTLPAPIPALGAVRAVMIDGRFRPDLSRLDGLPAGIRVQGLARVLAEDPDSIAGRLGALADPGSHPLAALNTALMEDGIVIEADEGARFDGVIHVASIGAAPGGRPVAFHPRVLVVLHKAARLTLAKSAEGGAGASFLDNPVTEISLAAGSQLTHVRLQDLPDSAAQLATTYVRLAEEATYDSFVLVAGAGLSRNEIHATLAGPRAVCHLNGAQLLGGARHADTTTAIEHAAPHCASRQTYKSVLAGRSRAVFQGRIHVRPAAQKTDGYQMNQALLLSPEAEMDSKPQLEIYADDVKCSHGATVGELDDGALFYLRSRGIPGDEARALLVQAFLADALDLVADATLREALGEATARWWRKVTA
jgi:Fe-S cluster assembly protein SufD